MKTPYRAIYLNRKRLEDRRGANPADLLCGLFGFSLRGGSLRMATMAYVFRIERFDESQHPSRMSIGYCIMENAK